MANKQQAPPPPVGGFTGLVPRPTIGQRARDHIRARRAARAARPRVPLVVVNTAPAPQQRRRRATRIPRGLGVFGAQPTARRARRRPPRRGTLFAVFSVAVATLTLTAAVVELASWTTAAAVFTAAEGVSMGTAWFFGDPDPPAKPPRPPRKPRSGSPPPKSGGHRCGAPTQGTSGKMDGPACQNPVTNAGERCRHHPGATPGGGTAPVKRPRTATGGPKRSRTKAAPPPTATP